MTDTAITVRVSCAVYSLTLSSIRQKLNFIAVAGHFYPLRFQMGGSTDR